jgi:hypothetical protein
LNKFYLFPKLLFCQKEDDWDEQRNGVYGETGVYLEDANFGSGEAFKGHLTTLFTTLGIDTVAAVITQLPTRIVKRNNQKERFNSQSLLLHAILLVVELRANTVTRQTEISRSILLDPLKQAASSITNHTRRILQEILGGKLNDMKVSWGKQILGSQECLERVFQVLRWLTNIGFEETSSPFDTLWQNGTPYSPHLCPQNPNQSSFFPVVINGKCNSVNCNRKRSILRPTGCKCICCFCGMCLDTAKGQ